MWTLVPCVKVLHDFVMVESVFSDFYMSTVITFIHVLKNILYTCDRCAAFDIDVAVELHQEFLIVWYNPGIIQSMIT